MTGTNPRPGRAVALALAAALATASIVAAQPTPRPRRDTRIGLSDERERLAAWIGERAESATLNALARRPAIAAAFARYRREGGLLPRLRFGEAHARTAGFSRGAEPGAVPARADSSRDRPLAFDLACFIPIKRTGFVVQDLDVWEHEIGGSMPMPGTTIRISVDVPAGLWRGERSFVSEATHGEGGTLVVPARGEPGQEASGRLVIDGRAGTIDDTRRVADLATGRVRVNALRVICARLPFSHLFGVGEPGPSRGE